MENDQTCGSKISQWDVAYLDNQGFNSLNELMRAIILRCVDDYHNKPLYRDDALEYLEDEEEDYIFSFRFICKHLGLDPIKTRDAIKFASTRISTRRRAA